MSKTSDDELREIIKRLCIDVLGARNKEEDELVSMSVRSNAAHGTAKTGSASGDEILYWLLQKPRKEFNGCLGESKRRLEFVSRAEAVAICQLAMDLGFLERTQKVANSIHLRRALLDDLDRVADRRRRIFRSGSHRFYRFSLPLLMNNNASSPTTPPILASGVINDTCSASAQSNMENVMTIRLERIKLPADAAGLVPAVGYVSASVSLELVVNAVAPPPSTSTKIDTDQSIQRHPPHTFFPRQRFNSTMLRRAPREFELNESCDFALPPLPLRSSTSLLIRLSNQGAHGLFHAKALGSAAVPLLDLLAQTSSYVIPLKERIVNHLEEPQQHCVSMVGRPLPINASPPPAPSNKVAMKSRQFAAEPSVQIQVNQHKKSYSARTVSSSEYRVRCVVYEARDIVYDLAETHGLRWQLQVRMLLVDSSDATRWTMKKFNRPSFFSNSQRIKGGGARFSFAKEEEAPPLDSYEKRLLSSTQSISTSSSFSIFSSKQRHKQDTKSLLRKKIQVNKHAACPQPPDNGQGGRRVSHKKKFLMANNDFRSHLLRCRQLLLGFAAVDDHDISDPAAGLAAVLRHEEDDQEDEEEKELIEAEIDDQDLDEDEQTDHDDHSVLDYDDDIDDSEVPLRAASHTIADMQDHYREDEALVNSESHQEKVVAEEEVIATKVEEEPIEEDILPRHTETTRDLEASHRFFQKLKVEAAANSATDAVRLVVAQKSRGGMARRVAAAVLPLSELPTTPPEPSWILATNVGPRGTLTRNGAILASVWIQDDDEVRREGSLSRFSEYVNPNSLQTCDDTFLLSMLRRAHDKKYLIYCGILILLLTSMTTSSWRFFFGSDVFKHLTLFFSPRAIKWSGLYLITCLLLLMSLLAHFLMPAVLGAAVARLIERYGVLGVCRVECAALRLSCFVVKASADDLPPRSDTIKKQSREAKRAAAKAGKLGAALTAATPKGRHWRIVLGLEVRGFRFFNPSASRYPHEHLASVKQLNLVLSMPLRHLLPAFKRIRDCRWRPSPRKCVSAFGLLSSGPIIDESIVDREPAPENTDDLWRRKAVQPTAQRPEVAAVLVVERCDLLGPQLNLEMDAASELNVVALTRDLADAKVAALLKDHQLAPNLLHIQVLEARNIPRQLAAQQRGGVSNFLTSSGRASCLTRSESETGCVSGRSPMVVNTASFTNDSIESIGAPSINNNKKKRRSTSLPPPPSAVHGCRPGQLLVLRCRIRDERQDSHHSSSLKELGGKQLGAQWHNEFISFSGRTDDASAVLALELFVIDSSRSKPRHSIGRWITTLEALANKPKDRLVHAEDGFRITRSGKDTKFAFFEVEGWFPLRDSELEYADPSTKSAEHLGAVRLRICWRHQFAEDKHLLHHESNFSAKKNQHQKIPTTLSPHDASATTGKVSLTKSAMDQLIENSQESKLRIGSLRYTARMLSTFPVLLDIRSIVLVDIIARLHDIFMGKAGQSVLGTGEHARVQIPAIIIDGDTFVHRDPLYGAVSIFDFLRDFFIRGCGPKMFSSSFIFQILSAISVVPR